MSKYSALEKWLGGQPGSKVVVSFAHMESVVGSSLPKSARKYRPWWGNEAKGRHVQCHSWMNSGWTVENVDMEHEKVVFARRSR